MYFIETPRKNGTSFYRGRNARLTESSFGPFLERLWRTAAAAAKGVGPAQDADLASVSMTSSSLVCSNRSYHNPTA